MGFGDLQSSHGLQLLDQFLADKSYLAGYVFNVWSFISKSDYLIDTIQVKKDNVTFEGVKKLPPIEFNNARRWYQHIASFSDGERQK